MQTIRILTFQDVPQAVKLDKKWFGEDAISQENLEKVVRTHPDSILGVFDNNQLLGFTTFEILEDNFPTDYVGDIIPLGKILFIQQFTTVTNYAIKDSSIDTLLLSAVEKKAKELECNEIWEGLAQNHPYSTQQNPQFDAFGFYVSHGFNRESVKDFAWSPNKSLSIPCFLFRKKIL